MLVVYSTFLELIRGFKLLVVYSTFLELIRGFKMSVAYPLELFGVVGAGVVKIKVLEGYILTFLHCRIKSSVREGNF
jgi:hypothetical protein